MITKALLYCTKNKPYLVKSNGTVERMAKLYDKDFVPEQKKFELYDFRDGGYSAEFYDFFNGHVVAVCDIEVEEIEDCVDVLSTKSLDCYELASKSCLMYEQLHKYLPSRLDDKPRGYAIHIKNLKVFDEPHELGERFEIGDKAYLTPKHAPQNMCYCGVATKISSNMYSWESAALISIQPQWLVKILNGEKTIEVIKKVLRDML